jgi:hypothetical protein
MPANTWYILGIASFASLGTFLYVRCDGIDSCNSFLTVTLQGYDTGIVSTS